MEALICVGGPDHGRFLKRDELPQLPLQFEEGIYVPVVISDVTVYVWVADQESSNGN